MSAKVTIWAWKQAERLPSGTVLLTLLALADTARDHGKIWASHGYIARKSKQGERTVRASIQVLEGLGLLRTEPNPGRPDTIWLTLTTVTLFEDGPGTDEPGALEKGPRRPRPVMPGSGAAPGAGGSASGAGAPAGRADEPNREPRKRTNAPIGASDARGTRLPEGWEPEPNIATLIGLSVEEAEDQFARFRDYWTAQPGLKGRKVDWPATWRNWCRNALERRNGRGSPATRSAGGIDFAAERADARVQAMVYGARQALTGGRRRWTLG